MDCGRGLSKGDCYLTGIHPTEGTSSFVHRVNIHTGSNSDQTMRENGEN